MNPYPGINDHYTHNALELFRYQAINNSVYKAFLKNLKFDVLQVTQLTEIPFLPISLFKTHVVKTGTWLEEKMFQSSGTTDQIRSKHYVRSIQKYLNNAVSGFESIYGSLKDWTILAYLPGYTENPGSSLIEMINHFIKITESKGSKIVGFDSVVLLKSLIQTQNTKQKTMLIGVSHALLDFALSNKIVYPDLIVMETGGMKGMKQELTKSELHDILKNGFGVDSIHSEEGMTELFSHAYSKGDGIFVPTSKLRVLIKDPTDPLETFAQERNGVIHVIDLANEDTCAFIATEDLGKLHADGSFELLGRLDVADQRGCNLLYYS